ncbi:MAG TPA: YfhL family 4Fe-4S dicluster ferredoxin [Terriglobales bacterium]|jgi:NAD-dependent dihydropyrimidine dehydrogenase PreA subunit|nr:YfhL family 4Fe-4S dicluster ferredoxin [Terriglobales bacterium]
MATMITSECISCGACEPECPNNAISQGDPVYIIDPKLCTECVGFHDYEACAAVCPVDVCVTDPNNVESEEALIARARTLHPETNFGDSFESRFRKGQGKAVSTPGDGAAAAKAAAGKATAESTGTATGPVSAVAEVDVNYVNLPEIDSWNIPMRCFKCNEVHVENVKNFMIGNVIFCPHCNKSTVVRDNLNYQIRTLLKDAYDRWQKEKAEFAAQRDRARAEFLERRAKEATSFEQHQNRSLAQIRQQLDALGENYDAPGRPFKKGSRFGWA